MSLPVIVGHRGFKSKYVENTITGFIKCYESGGTVIETDLWVSRDEYLIISHDGNTNRIFVDENDQPTHYDILTTNYVGCLEKLKTAGSGEPLMTFPQLLKWFVLYVENNPGPQFKIMLDLKPANPTKLLKYLIRDLLSIKNDIKWWYDHLQLGFWTLDFIKYMNQNEYFKTVMDGTPNNNGYTQFDIFHISVSWKYSFVFTNYNFYLDHSNKDDVKFKTTGVSLLYLSTWSQDFLTKFVPILKIQNLKLYSWTINFKNQYDYLVQIGKLANITEYGIITDCPDYMNKLRENESDTSKPVSHNENGDLSISLTWCQQLYNFMFSRFFVPPAWFPLDFESIVDEDKPLVLKPNRLVMWIFHNLQALGIF
jgi:phosphatidylglycerol phospholipase C